MHKGGTNDAIVTPRPKRPQQRGTKVEDNVTVKSYNVISRCVEEGINYGWNRAHKHTSTPTPDHVKAEIEQAILNSICEYFDFGTG
jgi:hypothetical protein